MNGRRAIRGALTSSHVQRGVTLMEVLVTILILGIGLMGMANLQIMSLRNTMTADRFNLVNGHLASIVERMRANAVQARAGNYNIALEQVPAGSGQVLADLVAWKGELAENLPSGDGAIDCAANGVCTITIRWIGNTETETAVQYTTQTLL